MEKTDINDFTCVLTFILLLIPAAIVWFALYLRTKRYIRTFLNYCVLISCSIIFLDLYFLLTGLIAFQYAGASILAELVGIISYVAVTCLGIPGLIMIVLTLMLTILYFFNKQHKHPTGNNGSAHTHK